MSYMLSKFLKESAKKWLIFPIKAGYARSLLYGAHGFNGFDRVYFENTLIKTVKKCRTCLQKLVGLTKNLNSSWVKINFQSTR
jgi:hypothetical protein